MSFTSQRGVEIVPPCAVRVEPVNYVRAVLSKCRGARCQIFRETFSRFKGWKRRFFFLDRRAIPDAMAWRHHDFDGGLATTWEFPGFRPIFKDTEGNGNVLSFCLCVRSVWRILTFTFLFATVTMSEYLRFPFLSVATILKALALTSQDQIEKHTTRPFSSGKTIPIKTDHQKRVEVEDPKIVSTRERKARAAAKKREKRKEVSTRAKHVSSLKALRAVGLIGPATENPSEAVAKTAESREDRSLHIPHHDSANISVHDDGGYVLTLMKGSRPETKLTMCPSGPSARESNALTNATALERAWFNLGRGASTQTDILERFENLQVDYDQLAETHSECGETIKKLVQARKPNSELSQVNKDQALRIRELEDELARKDSAVVFTERINVERALEKEKLRHEYMQSLSEPFNLAIQARWAKGLAEERSEENLSELMSRMEGLDPYADKKMFVEYEKLFEKQHPYVEKISRGFRHTVSDLLKVHSLKLLGIPYPCPRHPDLV
nr:hypothetical protein [Tanacetum cinerariifolium]